MTEADRGPTDQKPLSPAREYFSLDFFTAAEVYKGDGRVAQVNNSPFEHVRLIRFTDNSTKEETVAVIKSDYHGLIGDLKMVGNQKKEHPDVSRESMGAVLDRFAESYLGIKEKPRAEIWRGETESYIKCYETSCTFHNEQSCSNPKPMIYDDCPMDEWCMTYEPKEVIKND